ncbi:3-oxoacyl-[acyl-carrier-protein] synthase III C-terminal domain-containing protein [Variovorax sp. J2P1-59]|uniref:3-oxoacyl-[acyl-carrier-protein] synthase III C-terminal domain-containing protein n=1 Tax=Variovorax flavidus TaxID=3053501 RepID=UPI0025762713|nr:3-oxoacyl-[acyl-carrier-protein] synthase III C-terminal domain-containing protein [Variovorax sp. J2P1-59]MDM0077518.1 3-oxoacyl-[acyl-carrier-protein] synthase III C-terminal domain-containing protein [Variovorax sp. J2P1-59]
MLRPDTNGLKPVDPSEIPQFGIAAGASYLPPIRKRIDEWAAEAGPAARQLLPSMVAFGMANYHVAPDLDVEGLSCAGVQKLLDAGGFAPGDIDLVIFCHAGTMSTMAAPASIPAVLMKRFGMRNAIGYSISQQNCASIVCAIRLIRTLMWRHRTLENVLIVGADKVFGEPFRNVGAYAIQSDGALALLIRRNNPLNRIGRIVYSIDSRYYRGTAKSAELGKRYVLRYPLLAHQMMAQVMDESGWQAEDVDAVLPMNANLSAFQRVMELLGLPPHKLHSRNIGEVGHVFCCDPFANFLQRFAEPDAVGTGNAVVFASATSGIFCALGISRSWTGATESSPFSS